MRTIPLACLLLLLFLPVTGEAQQQYIYLVKAARCTSAPAERALTGFRVHGVRGIITALHGVADSQTITVMGLKGQPGNSLVTIYEVDVAHDLARLSSPEFERMRAEGLEIAAGMDWKARTSVRVIGYPLNIDLEALTLPLTIGEPPIKVLGHLVNDRTRSLLQARNSPSPGIAVLYLVGPLHPGHSGAPILDRNNRVIGVGDGGLQQFSEIGWAIPFQGLTWTPFSRNSLPESLKRSASAGLFSYDTDPQSAEERIRAMVAAIKEDTGAIRQDTARCVKSALERLNGSSRRDRSHF